MVSYLEVVYSRTVEGLVTSESSDVGAGVNISGLFLSGGQGDKNRAPVGKALRAALLEATNYLNCVMVVRDSCIAEYDAKEERRRENTGSILELQ